MKNRIVKICLVLISVLIVWGVYVILKSEPKTIAGLMESYENPGIKIKIRSPFSGTVLVAKKGEIIFKEAYGISNRATNEENKVDTKYGIGSVTKQFTAMLVMQLVEEGKLKLQDTIGNYLPYLPKEKANHITIHQLLTHTSGLAHYFALPAIGVNLSDFRKTKYAPKELVQLIGKTNMIAKPGEQFYYSSLGYDVLGAIIEEVSGKSFAHFLDEKIIQPLQLKNTGFASNEYISNELAKGYAYREVYGLDWWTSEHGGEIREAPFRDQSTAYAAGGMHSTVEDLFIWSEAVKSHKLLSPELTKIMLSPDKKGHCYGWVRNWDDIVEKNINARLYGHGGALTGNSAYIGMYDDGTTIIYLANINNLKAEEILHQLYLRANDLKDDYKLKGYPNRSSYEKFITAGGMTALKDYFQRLSEYSGYTVNPSNSTMRGVMKIHLEAGKQKVADSLKTVFLNTYNPNEATINEFGYDFLYSDNSDYALEFFIENTKRYPFSSNVWDSLGEAYLTYKDYDSAIDCYKKAVELGEQVNHISLEDYKENLKKAEYLNKS
jgi:CubicO group peptidase (beta-lactamase class C family)